MTKTSFSLTLFSLALVGCGSSSDNENTYDESFIQFYNASVNSKSTTITLITSNDTISIGSSVYGDATTTYTATPNGYQYSLSYFNNEGQEVTFAEENIDLDKSKKTLVVFDGDYDSPTLMPLTIDREVLDSEMKVVLVNLSSKEYPIDVSYKYLGDTYSETSSLGALTGKAHTTSDALSLGDYQIILSNADTGDTIFESETIALDYSIEYVVAIKDSYGPSESKLSLDVIGNSTTVVNYDDLDALAEFRVLQTESSMQPITVIASGKTPTTIEQLESGAISSFQQVEFGDYQLSILDESGESLVSNKLLSLNPNDSKSFIFYRDKSGELDAINFAQQVIPYSYQHQVQTINLIDVYDSLDVYFVGENETIETAGISIKSLSFAELQSKTLTTGEISVYLVHENQSGQQTLLARLDDIDLETVANFILIADEGEVDGDYVLSLIP